MPWFEAGIASAIGWFGSEASIDCELYATQIEIRSGKQSTANAACDEVNAALLDFLT